MNCGEFLRTQKRGQSFTGISIGEFSLMATSNTTTYNLDTCAMLVEFNASVWTARKLDKGVTDEVLVEKSAGAKSAGRFNKSLMAGRKELTDIQQCVSAARTYTYDNTVPWSDAGQRLLPTARFLKFDKRMDAFKAEFDMLVADFVRQYPTLITAQAMALGDMFNRSEYPPVSEMQRKFAFAYDYLPVPSSGDFRVDVGNDAQKELRERLERSAEARVQRAVGDVQTRLVEHLQRMSDRLVSDVDAKTGEAKSRRFHDTLVSGAYELCDMVGDFNITGNKTLAEARQRLEAALGGSCANTLRTDEDKREEVKKEVDALLNLFEFSV